MMGSHDPSHGGGSYEPLEPVLALTSEGVRGGRRVCGRPAHELQGVPDDTRTCAQAAASSDDAHRGLQPLDSRGWACIGRLLHGEYDDPVALLFERTQSLDG